MQIFKDSKSINFKYILSPKKEGIIPIYKSGNSAAVVFIHGFNSSSLSTWGIKNYTFWPYDIACKNDIDSFIFQYDNGYRKKLFSEPLKYKSVATDLIEGLHSLSEYKNIIIISHSFGGILFKEAFNQMLASDPGHAALARKITGFIPISCPNHGSWFAWGAIGIPGFFSDNARALRKGGDDLRECHNSFLINASSFRNLRILAFTEKARSYLVFRVNPEDAKIGKHAHWDSKKNHSGICKNLSPDSREYIKIEKEIIEFSKIDTEFDMGIV